jgi:hypothetical protein
MGRVKKDVPQTLVAVLVPLSWKETLQDLAKERSKKTGVRVTYIDLIRLATEKKYNLEHWTNGQIVTRKDIPEKPVKKVLIRR